MVKGKFTFLPAMSGIIKSGFMSPRALEAKTLFEPEDIVGLCIFVLTVRRTTIIGLFGK